MVANKQRDRREAMNEKTELRDRMRIHWDVPITMDDGLVLRADIYRPPQEGKYPVILSYGPYALPSRRATPINGRGWPRSTRM